MNTPLKLTALAALFTLSLACAKAPAQSALKMADDAVAAEKPEAEKYAADAFKSVDAALKSAHDKFNAGDYAGALAAAKDLPGKVEELKKQAMAKKDEMMKNWSELHASLPAMMQRATAKLGELAALKKLPAGMDSAKLEGAKADLASAGKLWSEAAEAGVAGDVAAATAKGGEVKAKLRGLMATLGMSDDETVAATSAPGSAPASAPKV